MSAETGGVRQPTTPPVSADIEDAYGSGTPLRRGLLLSALITGLALVDVTGALARQQYDDGRRSAVDNARARVILASAMIDSYFGGQVATLSAIAQSRPCSRAMPRPCVPISSVSSRRAEGRSPVASAGPIDRACCAPPVPPRPGRR